jgi:PTH1 family peptidyl-tRNA hydrolase
MRLAILDRLLGLFRPSDPFAALASREPQGLRLVVGLGNPGTQYGATRHNVGFRCVDLLAAQHGAAWRDAGGGVQGLVAILAEHEPPLVLVKPLTFMNRSGDAIARLVERLALPLADLMVVYDDMDLPLGALRLRERGSAGTHNGMRSIVQALGSDAFPRLRLGVGQAGAHDARDYVLSGFDAAEQPLADAAVARAAQAVLTWAAQGAQLAMNRFNGQVPLPAAVGAAPSTAR